MFICWKSKAKDCSWAFCRFLLDMFSICLSLWFFFFFLKFTNTKEEEQEDNEDNKKVWVTLKEKKESRQTANDMIKWCNVQSEPEVIMAHADFVKLPKHTVHISFLFSLYNFFFFPKMYVLNVSKVACLFLCFLVLVAFTKRHASGSSLFRPTSSTQTVALTFRCFLNAFWTFVFFQPQPQAHVLVCGFPILFNLVLVLALTLALVVVLFFVNLWEVFFSNFVHLIAIFKF